MCWDNRATNMLLSREPLGALGHSLLARRRLKDCGSSISSGHFAFKILLRSQTVLEGRGS